LNVRIEREDGSGGLTIVTISSAFLGLGNWLRFEGYHRVAKLMAVELQKISEVVKK
jgi:hypothetical protein